MEELPPLPLVSIIVPTLNEERHLPFLLESLLTINTRLDIIVVDGNSEDRTAPVVHGYMGRFGPLVSLRFIQSGVRNTSAQRNVGADKAHGYILLFLDADVIVPPGSFETLVSEFLRSGLSVGNPKFIADPHEKTIPVQGLLLFFQTFQRVMAACGRLYIAGACIITNKSVFTQVGGFNESMRLAEDIDFGRKAALHGKCGFLSAKVSTSVRRLGKIGPKQAWELVKVLPGFVATGKVPEEFAAHYPFGDY